MPTASALTAVGMPPKTRMFSPADTVRSTRGRLPGPLGGAGVLAHRGHGMENPLPLLGVPLKPRLVGKLHYGHVGRSGVATALQDELGDLLKCVVVTLNFICALQRCP